jgi:hypothetical protein
MLAGWLAIFVGMNALRMSAARKFLATPRELRIQRHWPRLSVIGHFAGGCAWGVLGAGIVLLRPDAPEYLLVSLFVIAIFAVAQAANPSRYPPAYYAWVIGAMGPALIAAFLEGGEVYGAATALGLMLVGALWIIGRANQRMMIEKTARDIERARLLESLTAQKDALDEANRAKTRFLAAASHDLRQPMQAITLLVESLQERAREPQTQAIVESIRASVSTMARLLNAILDISRFDAGTVRPERSHFALAPVLERVRPHPRAGGRGQGSGDPDRAHARGGGNRSRPALPHPREPGGERSALHRARRRADRMPSPHPRRRHRGLGHGPWVSPKASSARSSASSCSWTIRIGTASRDSGWDWRSSSARRGCWDIASGCARGPDAARSSPSPWAAATRSGSAPSPRRARAPRCAAARCC